ncbi:siderophore-interacting protein [Nocardioides sp. GY 10113]|nr:siderophore-interacting protein [Nocardioides sp. GY 10113]
MILDRVVVRAAERVSPSVMRFELGGDGLADFGVDGPVLDQRIKLIFPNAAGELPSFEAGESWWTAWQQLPEAERGSIRTYTIRDVLGSGTDTRLVVDIVVHEPAPGERPDGPGNAWALGARVGDELITICPRRGHPFGGIEWDPDGADRLLIVGDETAAPAIRGILRDLPAHARGAVFLETATAADAYDDMVAPAGVSVTWLPREGGRRGAELQPAVLDHLTGAGTPGPLAGDRDVEAVEVDPNLWETPAYSSSGEETGPATATTAGGFPGLYAWIAGESRVVTGLRRALVGLGVDRRQVAFMGYWRDGVAMRS